MIVIGNQIALQFNIGNISDFISIECFHGMRIAENAGGLRPIINLDFQVTHEEVIPYLNSGNIITIMYGINTPTSEVMQFEILGDGKTKDYHVGSTVSILGAMYKRTFTSQVKSTCYANKRSFEALANIANDNGLKFVTNVSKSNDRQTWYQSGITDWNMSTYIASRAYKDNGTFFNYAFDNNNYYFYDIREQLKAGPKWILAVGSTGTEHPQSNIVNIGTYMCDDSAAGTNADFAGKNLTNVNYNVDTGEFSNPQYALKTFTTMGTTKINVNATDCANYDYHITSEDEHAFSVTAQNQNFRNQMLFSSYCCHVPVAGQYREFKLLDCVQLVPQEPDAEAAGIYFITSIAKEYKEQQYSIMLTLHRESANGIRGEALQGGM